jgi:signal transduction histidine kinase
VARYIVERHNGTISAESDGPGRGATFTVTLPRLQPTQDLDVAVPAAVVH